MLVLQRSPLHLQCLLLPSANMFLQVGILNHCLLIEKACFCKTLVGDTIIPCIHLQSWWALHGKFTQYDGQMYESENVAGLANMQCSC